ncbi:MAG: hypothetical protein ACJ76N_28750 [Thermoanaerobaculia bacterium]
MRFHRTTTLVLVGCLALFGCKKKEEPLPAPEVSTAPQTSVETTPATVPFKVSSVDLGKAVGPDKKITDPASTFGPKDTIYASVATEGTAPSVKLHARWTFGTSGQVVKEEDLDLAPTGPANTEFHISKPSGWPVGKYKVEISADGASAASKDFEVKK